VVGSARSRLARQKAVRKGNVCRQYGNVGLETALSATSAQTNHTNSKPKAYRSERPPAFRILPVVNVLAQVTGLKHDRRFATKHWQNGSRHAG